MNVTAETSSMASVMESMSTLNTTTSLSITNASMLLAMAVLTVCGNVTVLIILWKDPARELRTTSNFLIANLATSDLILGLLGEPLYATNHWIDNPRFYLICRCVIDLSLVSSFMSILALSLERYFMLKTEGRIESSFRRGHAIACAVAIWTLSTTISSLIFAFTESDYKFILAFGVGLPIFVVMLGVYINVFLIVRRVYRKDFMTKQDMTNNSVDEAERQAERIRARELKVAWTIFTIVGVVFFFWIPAIISDTVGKFCPPNTWCHLSKNMSDSMVIVGFLNAAFNPIVYSLRTKKFRKAVYLLFFASRDSSKTLTSLVA